MKQNCFLISFKKPSSPTSQQLCTCTSVLRGFMSKKGVDWLPENKTRHKTKAGTKKKKESFQLWKALTDTALIDFKLVDCLQLVVLCSGLFKNSSQRKFCICRRRQRTGTPGNLASLAQPTERRSTQSVLCLGCPLDTNHHCQLP